MARNPLGPPPFIKQESAFDRWMRLLWQRVVDTGQILWSQLDFTGSNLTDLATRNHADLQNLNTASYTHLTSANHTDLTDGGATTLHKHDHAAQDNLNSASYYHLTQANHTDLTDGGDSTLHYHAADRALANATGTLALANGGTGQALTDPNADRILFWDDSAGAITWLTAGSGLTITDTTITASGGGTTLNNVISVETTIDADTSYVVIGYLHVEATFNVDGNVEVL